MTPLAIEIGDPEIAGAAIAAAASLVVAVLTALAAYTTRKNERRRDLYSRAFRAAMSWKEMLYRVRRRRGGADLDFELINRFHDLQEEIDYFQGWLGSESLWLARSYCSLVESVKNEVIAPTQQAWLEADRRPPGDGTKDEDVHPNVTKESEAFLSDVRCHLSFWVVPRIMTVWRNRKWLGGPHG